MICWSGWLALVLVCRASCERPQNVAEDSNNALSREEDSQGLLSYEQRSAPDPDEEAEKMLAACGEGEEGQEIKLKHLDDCISKLREYSEETRLGLFDELAAEQVFAGQYEKAGHLLAHLGDTSRLHKEMLKDHQQAMSFLLDKAEGAQQVAKGLATFGSASREEVKVRHHWDSDSQSGEEEADGENDEEEADGENDEGDAEDEEEEEEPTNTSEEDEDGSSDATAEAASAEETPEEEDKEAASAEEKPEEEGKEAASAEKKPREEDKEAASAEKKPEEEDKEKSPEEVQKQVADGKQASLEEVKQKEKAAEKEVKKEEAALASGDEKAIKLDKKREKENAEYKNKLNGAPAGQASLEEVHEEEREAGEEVKKEEAALASGDEKAIKLDKKHEKENADYKNKLNGAPAGQASLEEVREEEREAGEEVKKEEAALASGDEKAIKLDKKHAEAFEAYEKKQGVNVATSEVP